VFGGEFADIIRSAPGVSLLADGEDGNDTLWGGTADDILSGGKHNDTLIGNAGADLLNGGLGTDTAVFDNSQSAYRLSREAGTGVYLVTHIATGDVDRLVGIELLKFCASVGFS
jgi:Ca2+-binding RTX toxin-like protein